MENENNYQRAARRRVAKELEINPNKYSELGSKGGSARVSKGIGKLDPERRKEISRLGQEARKALREAKKHRPPTTLGVANETEQA